MWFSVDSSTCIQKVGLFMCTKYEEYPFIYINKIWQKLFTGTPKLRSSTLDCQESNLNQSKDQKPFKVPCVFSKFISIKYLAATQPTTNILNQSNDQNSFNLPCVFNDFLPAGERDRELAEEAKKIIKSKLRDHHVAEANYTSKLRE